MNIEQPGGANSRTTPYLFDGQSTDYMYKQCSKKSIYLGPHAGWNQAMPIQID